jgi:HEPN domain-containing protein
MITDKEECRRWLEQAKNTLKSAERDKQSGDYNWCCFKAQQAAEFALKGLLYGVGVSAVGHSLLKLLGELEKKGFRTGELASDARILDRHYIPTRYVNAHAEGAPFEFYDLPTAEEALKSARKIVDFVRQAVEHG